MNGNVITMDAADTIAQAVAIKDGLVLQTGTSEAIRALAGPQTQTIDLRGKTVTPGLIDAHNHLQLWGTLLTDYVPLIPPDVKTLDDLLARLGETIAQAKPEEWVQGYFWDLDPPRREQIDPISPNTPVWLMQQGGHFASVNSAALGIAGITAQTRNPEGGIIERDQQGNPTGVLYNHRAMDLVRAHMPQPTPQQIANSLKTSEMKMAEVGVTTYQDVNARFAAIQGYMEFWRAKGMTLRSQIFYTLEWPGDLDRALQMERISDEYMRFAGYKFLIDGQFPTWYTHEPHPGISWDMPTWNPDQFKQTVKALHDTGLQIAVHCGGDAAVDLTLDAYEAAMKANPRQDPRHRIEHATLASPSAFKRAGELGVVISTQPQFVRAMGDLPGKIGEERAKRVMATRDWLNAGAKLALGSDTPTSPWYSPHVTLAQSVLRYDQHDEPFHPEQALTIQEALRAHTMGSAYACFEENVKGSLEPGKMADLSVWSDNIYSIKPQDIVNTTIEMTIIGGKIVYEQS
ncbi:MAG: hypothetical protein A2148_10515 [Chloroflexi bacterium RBG_16_68_14]|nr:MAG: hypothetical protein A2148_10515 [Chloroflexi bacterium RBG_16_68_14]